jgi:predicted membrane-bound mannosyltransferase/sugar lactone lactonase YvrE
MEFDANIEKKSWLDRPLADFFPKLTIETLIIFLIIALTIFSRFYILEARVMSHDEVNHVVPSWELYQGNGYRHDPVTHGPFQFHMLALSYFMFGDSDFSARVPAALFSIAAVVFVLYGFKRYLGRVGAIAAGLFFMISPFMLYYGRYTRNEAFLELIGVVTIYALLRYLEKGDSKSLYLLVATTAVNFTIKETAYIHTAILLLFVGFRFVEKIAGSKWPSESSRNQFIISTVVGIGLAGLALGLAVWDASLPKPTGEELESVTNTLSTQMLGVFACLGGAIISGLLAVLAMVNSLGWKKIKSFRSFDVMVLIFTLIWPLLAAVPIKMIGWNPLDYSNMGLVKTGIVVVVLFAAAAAIGIWWRPKTWLTSAAIFYSIFILFYTTFFTYGRGFVSGLVGGLGYWMSQQSEQRGSQPLYYYALIQMPIYEYLALLGTFLAAYIGAKRKLFSSFAGYSPACQPDFIDQPIDDPELLQQPEDKTPPSLVKIPVLGFLIYLCVMNLLAFSIAGERMPWMTTQIVLPFLLAAGWGVGYLIDKIDWLSLKEQKKWALVFIVPIFLSAFMMLLGNVLGNEPPFQGKTTVQLEHTSKFLLSLAATLVSGWGILYFLKEWKTKEIFRLLIVTFMGIISVLTIRTGVRAAYINYDNAKEYLVYAHAASGPKEVLAQVEEISRRTTQGLEIKVAYDNDALYPYWWYFRDYPNHFWYTDKPTQDLRNYPLIIAGDSTMNKLDPIVRDDYVVFDYKRLWWPNQDYFNLTWERIWNAIKDPQMRTALFDIWMDRDYSLYADLKQNTSLTLENWQPSSGMKFFVRKDVVAQIWNYGSTPIITDAIETDPYEGKIIDLPANLAVGYLGAEAGQFNAPRGMATAPDGTIYVADSGNHRIQHLSTNGEVLDVWGGYGDTDGRFNEPWGLSVGPDGSVYVADTWNHRIQKFSPSGEFLTAWGYFGQAENAMAFWGPRDVSVDSSGQVYVTDTGNKRIVVFDADGNFITQFGSVGYELGQFDEPVGLAVSQNRVFVVDTWNQRVQQFEKLDDSAGFVPENSWDVYAWFGQSLDNKPYITIDGDNVFLTDPEGYRILQFNQQGEFIQGWGKFSVDTDGFGLAAGVTVDGAGNVWVSDASNNRLLRFFLP